MPRNPRYAAHLHEATVLRFPTSVRIDHPRIHRPPVAGQRVHPRHDPRALRVPDHERFPAPLVLLYVERILHLGPVLVQLPHRQRLSLDSRESAVAGPAEVIVSGRTAARGTAAARGPEQQQASLQRRTGQAPPAQPAENLRETSRRSGRAQGHNAAAAGQPGCGRQPRARQLFRVRCAAARPAGHRSGCLGRRGWGLRCSSVRAWPPRRCTCRMPSSCPRSASRGSCGTCSHWRRSEMNQSFEVRNRLFSLCSIIFTVR